MTVLQMRQTVAGSQDLGIYESKAQAVINITARNPDPPRESAMN